MGADGTQKETIDPDYRIALFESLPGLPCTPYVKASMQMPNVDMQQRFAGGWNWHK